MAVKESCCLPLSQHTDQITLRNPEHALSLVAGLTAGYKEQADTRVWIVSDYPRSDMPLFTENHVVGLERQLRAQKHLMILEKTLVWFPILAWWITTICKL